MLVEAGLLSQPDPLEGSFPPRARRVHDLASRLCLCFAFLRLANKAAMMSKFGVRVQRVGQASWATTPSHLGSSLPHALAPHRSIVDSVFVRTHTPTNIEQPCHTLDIRLNLGRRQRRTQAA